MTSADLFIRAKKILPGGVNSPVRSFKYVDRSPVYFEKGEGPFLLDVEGNSYIDFCAAFGPLILGHSHPAIVRAIQEQAAKATTFGACHPKELELAEWLLKAYPTLDNVRLMNSGTEAVMTAIRIARGATGREKILMFEGCYHGHSDGLLAKAGSGVAELAESTSSGVPASLVKETVVVRWDDYSQIEKAFSQHELAAIILEPVPANCGLWVPGYERVKKLFSLAKSKGTLVIFDEVITGFRLGLGGASAYYDCSPDLVTLGKVIGGGLPLAAVVGKKDWMQHLAPTGKVYQAGTLSGNPLACAAGIAAISALFENRMVWNAFEGRCEEFVKNLSSILNNRWETQVRNLGSLFWIYFGDSKDQFPPEFKSSDFEKFSMFFKACLEEGVYLPPSPYEVGFVSFAHSEAVLEQALSKIKNAIEKLL